MRLTGLDVTDQFVRVVIAGDASSGTWARVRLRWIGDTRQMAGDPVEERRTPCAVPALASTSRRTAAR
jgi:hypothetical protein